MERPKWLFVHFGHSKWTPAERPHQAGKPERGLLEEQLLSLLRRQLPLHRGAFELGSHREPGFRQLGTVAHQGKALAIEVPAIREAGTSHGFSMPSM